MDVDKVNNDETRKTYTRKFRSKRRRKTKKTINQHSAEYVIRNIVDNIVSNEESPHPTTEEEPVTISPEFLQPTTGNETNTSLNASYSKLVSNPVIPNELADEVMSTTKSATTATKKMSFKGYQIVDDYVLDDAIKQMACPQCFTIASIELSKVKKQGLAFLLQLSCNNCDWSYNFWSSKKSKNLGSYDINLRTVYSMRRIGKGYSAIKLFFMLMNLPLPMAKASFYKLSSKINKAVKNVAQKCIQDAAKEARAKSLNNCDEGYADIRVSNDGAWQRRGFSSLNGNVTTIAMDTGKIIDYESMSRYCQTCISLKKIKTSDPQKYEESNIAHQMDCLINHKGSAPAMEVFGTKNIFERSLAKHNLRYIYLLGDGDTKSFTAVENIYPGIKVNKLECVGHVQKRVGNRLRKLKTKVKGKFLFYIY